MPTVPAGIFETPDLYWFEYHENQARFARMTRESYFNSIFTDRARIITSSPDHTMVDIDQLLATQEALAARPARMNLIFHTANCGSTLLSRALDLPGRTLACREPFPLRQLGVEHVANANANGMQKLSNWQQRLGLALTLLGRRFSDTEVPVVKANIPVNFILPEMLDLLPEYRGVILYSSLESFLIAALKVPKRRQWLRGVAGQMYNGISTVLPAVTQSPGVLSDAKLAAALWIAQIDRYHRILKTHDHLAALESERLFEHPEDTLSRVANLFEIDISKNEITAIVKGDLFSRHAKIPSIAYSADARKAEQDSVANLLKTELREGMDWGAALLERCSISPELPCRLFKN